LKRSDATDPVTTSRRVRTLNTGCSGSIRFTAPRIAGASAAGLNPVRMTNVIENTGFCDCAT
jgi:hypothetical protein